MIHNRRRLKWRWVLDSMIRFSMATMLLAFMAFSPSPVDAQTSDAPSGQHQLTALLRTRIQELNREGRFSCRGELVCGLADLPLFYARRGFEPAWVSDGTFPLADRLVAAVYQAQEDGLEPTDYHTNVIEEGLGQLRRERAAGYAMDPGLAVDLDLLLSDAFLLLGSHLLAGRVNPETIHASWVVNNPRANLAGVLQAALDSGNIHDSLDSLRPPAAGYRALKAALLRYRQIENLGGWPALPGGLAWRKGDYGARISLLHDHLTLTGDLEAGASANPFIFDEATVEALRRFQSRNGLPATGEIDDRTLTELNVPAEERVRRILVNLERWRWVPHDLGRTYLLVNVADFRLDVVQDGQTVLDMRVVVGRDYRRTPVFSARMDYLVINPYWNIPVSIAVKDILPKARRDPDYLSRHKIRVFESWSDDAREIDPRSVDWSKVNRSNLRYRLRKDPGPQNDLGRIKFMFPNKFAVYLHDTPNRKLFLKENRMFSSGCIRVEQPIELAEFLLRDDPAWTRERILAAINDAHNRVVRLKTKVPVHLLYWTAWVDNGGRVNFRDDIYGRDALLELALSERPPRVHHISRVSPALPAAPLVEEE